MACDAVCSYVTSCVSPSAAATARGVAINAMHIRPERSGDVVGISSLIARAFASAPHSNGFEQSIVLGLREAGALTVSLVAEEANSLVGHVAFSPVSVTDGSRSWFGLGPVAVEPSRQKLGIGSALINEGLRRLRDLGAAGCVVLGEPEYYGRFGFSHHPGLQYPGPPPEYFLASSFGGPLPKGEVVFHASFLAGT